MLSARVTNNVNVMMGGRFTDVVDYFICVTLSPCPYAFVSRSSCDKGVFFFCSLNVAFINCIVADDGNKIYEKKTVKTAIVSKLIVLFD